MHKFIRFHTVLFSNKNKRCLRLFYTGYTSKEKTEEIYEISHSFIFE
jgi:hypothetical protein